MRKKRRVALLVLLTALVACAEDEGPGRRQRFTFALPSLEGPESESWQPRIHAVEGEAEDAVVARVNGVPILASELRAALSAAEPESAPDDVLGRLVERELLAQHALSDGYYRPEVVGRARRAALVSEFIAERFVRPPPESFFTEEMLQHIYNLPGVRVLFDHKDVFLVVDVQFVCCDMHYSQCDRAQFERCMEEEEPYVWPFYEELRQLPPGLDSVRALVRDWQRSRPRLSLRDYSFFWDVDLPYEAQTGFSVVNENVAEAAMSVAAGQWAAPVRSNNAWHILFVEEHHPEKHLTLEDEEVRTTIIERALPKRLEGAFELLVHGLRAVYDARIFPERVAGFFYGLTKEAEVH